MSDYWHEAVSCALDEMGRLKDFTADELKEFGEAMRRAAEMESESTGRIYIPNPLETENTELKRKLAREESKVGCLECDGTGRIISAWGGSGRTTNSQCFKCRGEGKYLP